MKLDLVNSRLKYEQGPRIFDSIEGDLIQAPPVSPQAISKVSFLSKQHRLDYSPKTEPIPDRFNNSVVDRCGSYLPINKSPKHRIPSKTVHHKANTDEFLLDEFPSEIVDLMKDHIYKIKEETVQRRLESGKLPGGVWDTVGRKSTPPAYNIGPGDYEVYSSDITYRGRSSIKGGQFKTQPSGREHDEEIDPNYLPLKERKRYLRMMAAQQAKIESASRLRSSSSPPRPKGSIGTLSALSIGDTADENGEGSASLAGSPINIKSKSLGSSSLRGRGTKERFDDRIYKQESFVKTSGMTLSADWDKKLIKKIPFSFQPPEHSKKSFHKTVNKSEGADVDVDVGHFYSIVRTAQLSPVKYSAAFKSSAKVGMEIPVPTSGTEIGPCSFPGAHVQAIQIKNPDRPSHFILRGRPSAVRPPVPALTEEMKSFAELHQSGPVFEKNSVGGGNVVLQEIVKQKMKKIYPKLADQKFPVAAPVDTPSPWRRKKRK